MKYNVKRKSKTFFGRLQSEFSLLVEKYWAKAGRCQSKGISTEPRRCPWCHQTPRLCSAQRKRKIATSYGHE
jgi:hypothetical protein